MHFLMQKYISLVFEALYLKPFHCCCYIDKKSFREYYWIKVSELLKVIKLRVIIGPGSRPF